MPPMQKFAGRAFIFGGARGHDQRVFFNLDRQVIGPETGHGKRNPIAVFQPSFQCYRAGS